MLRASPLDNRTDAWRQLQMLGPDVVARGIQRDNRHAVRIVTHRDKRRRSPTAAIILLVQKASVGITQMDKLL